MKALIELTAANLNGIEDAEEWEEVDFMVDSGAATTVISPDEAKAIKLSDPDPSRTYKLADGSIIQNKGTKTFNAQAEDEQWRLINAQVTDVDKALLSVSQIVQKGGATVVFSPEGSYIQSPGGSALPMELRNNVYHLRMWFPRTRTSLFTGGPRSGCKAPTEMCTRPTESGRVRGG